VDLGQPREPEVLPERRPRAPDVRGSVQLGDASYYELWLLPDHPRLPYYASQGSFSPTPIRRLRIC